MISIPTKCIINTEGSEVVFEENRRKMIFHNPQRKRCQKVQVDGCAITEGTRCDKLLVYPDSDEKGDSVEDYVELKGEDVLHAMHQILNTIPRIHKQGSRVNAFIIPTNYSPAVNSERQKTIAELKKMYGKSSQLTIKSRVCEQTI